ncbi:MAG TPA: carboxymuconolactone decarboxylase family protein [Acidimicrobiales bacterium]|nr:carboxymuconolactone decarboxylase family protein [Acidimicrobiales bacterium]
MIARIGFDELDPELREVLRPRVERLGYLGEFFQCAAHQPEALISLNALTEQLRGALPDDAAEIVALTVATVTGNDYERHQHERLSLKLGFDEAWIRTVIALEEGGIIQRTVLDLLADRGRGADVDALAAEKGDAFAVAVLLLTGRYLMHSTVVNALGLAPPVPSPLADS